jgi:hypothetical protein
MKTYRMVGALVLALSAGAVGCDDDDDPISPTEPTSFTASLAGGNERPAITSTGTGTATFTVNANGSIAYVVRVNNLTSNVTACHIHFGRTDISGGVLVTLCPSGTPGPITTETTIASGTIVEGPNTSTAGSTPTTLAGLRELMESGSVYVNVHTANNTGGEIRGQITVVNP